jgi:hypothetical protein
LPGREVYVKPLLLLSVLASCAAVSAPALAQLPAPGAPLPGCGGFSPFVLGEPPEGSPTEFLTFALPCQVFSGFVVLLENPAGNPGDPTNWSDVAIFYLGPGGPPPAPGSPATVAALLSDVPNAAGVDEGIDPVAFQNALGFPVTEVVTNPTTVYLGESETSMVNSYVVGDQTYVILSDPPENPVPTNPSTWGRIKGLYR